MRRMARGPLRYGVAVLAVELALSALFIPVLGKGLGSVLFLAVLISAWYGGLGPGLFATALILVAALVLSAALGTRISPSEVAGLVLFSAGGALITALVEALHAARRRAESDRRWLEAVLTGIGDAVIATDAQGRVTFTNPVAQSLTGWKSGDAEGRPLEEVFRIQSEVDRESVETPVARVLREGIVVGLANHTVLVARDGAERPIDDSAAPIRDERGGVSGVVLVFRDVTERRRSEAALREADRRKDEFLAMLAHELRNPLAAINNAVHLSRRLDAPEHRAWAHDVLDRQVRHLSRLVDDLLDVSRITRGKVQLRKERVDIAPILASAVDTVQPLVDERKHALALTRAAGPVVVEGDPTRLEQIVVNLLTNAAKYTPNGGQIALSAEREGEEVVIRVRDNGVGLPAELRSSLFDLFVQGDRSLARSEGGLGIGLTLVRRLTELHGGRIAVSSEGPGQGTEFVLRLPAAEAPAASGPASSPHDQPAKRGLRVLVVDDNIDTARGMARLLKLSGHAVEVAHDGPAALELARTHRPESVLLDIGLPGMDGYEVAERLRAVDSCKDALVIAVTGYGQDEDRRRSRAAGFDHHLVKPVDPEALLTLLRGDER